MNHMLKLIIPFFLIAGAAALLWPQASSEGSLLSRVKGIASRENAPALPQVAYAYPIPTKVGAEAPIEINARAAIVIDGESGTVLYEKNADEVLPIASLSKLVTAAVFLEQNPGWHEVASLTPAENDLAGGKLRENPNEDIELIDLFGSALTGSANNAAWALMRSTGMTKEQFAAEMNAYVKRFGLTQSFFDEPTGLSEKNVSTAREFAKVVADVRNEPMVVQFLHQKTHDFYTATNKRFHSVKSSNAIFDEPSVDVVMSKTGFTYEAMYTLATVYRGASGQELIVVTLGSESDEARIADNVRLVTWTFQNYTWL